MDIYPHEKKLNQNKGPSQPFPEQCKSLFPEMQKYLRKRELSFMVARKNGWYPTNLIDGAPRIVIPGTNDIGRSYWQARAMDKNRKRYMSAKGGRQGSVIAMWPMATCEVDDFKIVVVEGPMDALAAATCGHLGVATMGKQSISFAVDYIVEHYKCIDATVLVVPDMDSPEFGVDAVGLFNVAGIKATMKIASSNDLAAMPKEVREEFLR